MNLMLDKLKILADSAKYDVSCSSSGVGRRNNGTIGSGASEGICHTWSADGRCISLLKVLFTNKCVYDCEYCVNRRSADGQRVSFEPEELAQLTIEFYRRNYIEGLFLSSGIIRRNGFFLACGCCGKNTDLQAIFTRKSFRGFRRSWYTRLVLWRIG